MTSSTVERGARRERLAAERRRVIARTERGGDLGARPARADGYAVAERFGHRHDVGPDAAVLEPEPAAGTTEPGLHFVHDQQGFAFVAQLAHRPRYSGDAGFTPPSPCTGFEHHGGHPVVERGRERVDVVERRPAGTRSGSGWNVSCFCGCPVAASVVSVRPWNEP